jgi:type IV secretion system protein VirD4
LIANAIVTSGEDGKGHPFFTRADTAFLASLFAHASTFENATPAAAYDFLTTHPGKLLTQALLESPNRVAREFAVIFSQSEAKLRGSIIMGVATQLMWLRDERIRRFTSSSLRAADFGSLRTAEASIYWCLSESDVAVLKPLSTLFFTLALYQVKRAEGAVAVNFLLDELANIGQIPNLDVEVAILRGRGVGLTIGLQSVSQLEQMYGRAAAKVIMDCINTTVVRRGLDADSAEHISRALGEQTHVEQKRSSTKKAWAFFDMPNETKSEAKHARAVLTADEVRRIGNQEQLMITTNRRPVRMNGWWWTTEKCEATAGACGEVLTERFSVEKGSELSAGLDDEPMMPESLKAKVGAEVG